MAEYANRAARKGRPAHHEPRPDSRSTELWRFCMKYSNRLDRIAHQATSGLTDRKTAIDRAETELEDVLASMDAELEELASRRGEYD